MGDESKKVSGRGTRPRGHRIEVWVTLEEKDELTLKAANAGLSVSSYMKNAGMNAKITSKVELSSVSELVKLNADLGRAAGLLKLWLSEKKGIGAKSIDVNEVMTEFRRIQTEMRNIMSRVIK